MKIYHFIIILFFFAGCSSYEQASNTKDNLKKALMEKAERAGIYLAASRQAEKEGYSEVAVYLGELAEEEVKHIKNLSVSCAKLKRNTKRNLKKILKIEKEVSRHTYPKMARIARDEKKEEVARLFEKMTKDEERHYLGLKGLLEKMRN